MQLGKSLASGAIIGVGLWFFGDAPILSVLVISVGVFLLLSRRRFIKQLRTFPRDFRLTIDYKGAHSAVGYTIYYG